MKIAAGEHAELVTNKDASAGANTEKKANNTFLNIGLILVASGVVAIVLFAAMYFIIIKKKKTH